MRGRTLARGLRSRVQASTHLVPGEQGTGHSSGLLRAPSNERRPPLRRSAAGANPLSTLLAHHLQPSVPTSSLQLAHQLAFMPPANASGPGWGSLSEDLVCAVAELLPVREWCAPRRKLSKPADLMLVRTPCPLSPQMSCHLPPRPCSYGALPLLNRHFYAISQRWPIQCGVYLLAEPAGRITKKVRPWAIAFNACKLNRRQAGPLLRPGACPNA